MGQSREVRVTRLIIEDSIDDEDDDDESCDSFDTEAEAAEAIKQQRLAARSLEVT